MAKKKTPGADEPHVLGKWVKDIPMIEELPDFLISYDEKGKLCKCPAADAIKMIDLAKGMSLIALKDGELVRFFPKGKRKNRRKS